MKRSHGRCVFGLALVAVLAGGADGCNKKKTSAGSSKPSVAAHRPGPVMAATKRPALQVFPRTTPLLLALRPNRWKRARTHLAHLAPLLPAPLASKVGAASRAPSLVAALAPLFNEPKASAAAPRVASLLDSARPLLVALLLGDVSAMTPYLQAGSPIPPSAVPSALHLRITLPTAQAASLARELGTMIQSSGLRRWKAAETKPGLQGGQVFRSRTLIIGVVPQSGFVRVELQLKPWTQDDAARSRAFGQVAATAESSTPRLAARMTPALIHALGSRSLVSIYYASAGIRWIATVVGARQVARAMENATPDLQIVLWRKAGELLTETWHLLSPAGASFEDLSIAVRLDSGLLLETVSSLTQAGVAAYDRSSTASPFVVKAQGVAARIDLRGDLRTLVEHSQRRLWFLGCEPAFERKTPFRALYRLFGQCGIFCSFFPLVSGPWGYLRGALRAAHYAPRGAQPPPLPKRAVVLIGDASTRSGNQGLPGITAGFQVGSQAEATALAGWLRRQKGLAEALHSSLTVRRQKAAHGYCVLAGLNQDPARVITSCASAHGKDRTRLHLAIDLSQVTQLLPVSPHSDFGRLLAGLGRLRVRSRRVGRALVLQAALGLRGATPPALPAPPRFSSKVPLLASPLPRHWAKPARCLACLPWVVSRALEPLPVSPDLHALPSAEALVGPTLTCARKDPALRARADRVESMLLASLAAFAGNHWRFDAERRFAKRACALGNKRACSGPLDRLTVPPFKGRLRLAPLQRTPAAHSTRPLGTLVLLSDQAVVAGRAAIGAIPPGTASLAASLGKDWGRRLRSTLQQASSRQRTPRLQSLGGQGAKPARQLGSQSVSVAIDQEASLGRARELLHALARMSHLSIALVLRGKGNRVFGLRAAVAPQKIARPGHAARPAPPPPPTARPRAGILGALARQRPLAASGMSAHTPAAGVHILVKSRGFTVRGNGVDLGDASTSAGCPAGRCGSLEALATLLQKARTACRGGCRALWITGAPTSSWSRVVSAIDAAIAASLQPPLSTPRPWLRLYAPSLDPKPPRPGAPASEPSGGGLAGALRLPASGHLSSSLIRRVMKQHRAEFRYCYASKGLARHPTLAGTVRLRFLIALTGRVAGASVASSTLRSPAVERCLLTVLRRIRFPRSKAGMPMVNYPLTFRPSR